MTEASKSEETNFLDLGNYVIKKPLAKGGYGKIYIVIDKNNEDQMLVAKESKKELTSEDRSLQISIGREVNLLAQLNHPYIVKFIGYSPTNFKKQKRPVIIMEYLPNGSLESILQRERDKRPPKSWTMTKKLINIFGIASVMSYIHKNKVIHRDLKPSNVLEDEYLFPKIADFGISKIQHSENSISDTNTPSYDKSTKGTVGYIAPEIINDNLYSESSDVYAYGMIVYDIMTLETPYKGKTGFQIMESVSKGERPFIKNSVPRCYCRLIEKCWSQSPSNRPSFDEIVHVLKSNKKFITLDVDENEYLEYIKLVENKGEPINPSKKFKRITLTPHDSRPDFAENVQNSPLLDEIKEYPDFKNLEEETVKIFEKNMSNNNSNKLFTVSNSDTIILYSNSSLSSPSFSSILRCFSNVIFQLRSDIRIFNDVFECLSNLFDSNEKIVRVHIFVNDTSGLSHIIRNRKVPISITINPNMTAIESNAFSECSSLYEIEIPSSINKIGDHSFNKCSSLEKILIPENVTDIGEGAFNQCILLEKVEILSQLKEIKNSTFAHCESLKEIILPSSVKVIGKSAFEGCFSLSKIEYPSTIESIEERAFGGCGYLKEFVIPPTFSVINDGVFYDCESLTQITIPSSITSIGSDSFNSCTSLVEIKFENPSSLKFISDRAFSACSSLERITIPQSVKSLGSYCFFACIKLKEVSITSLKTVNSNTFEGCISLTKFIIPYPSDEVQKYAFSKCYSLKIMSIPESVTSIGFSSFNCCTSLVELTIPSSVTSICPYAFEGCTSLASMSIPSKVTLIGSYAFCGCTSLIELIVPSSVNEIGQLAFKGCSKLTELTFEPHITKIEDGLFKGCTALKSISIPNSVTEIGEDAFQLCVNLQYLDIPSSLAIIGQSAFYGCVKIKKIKIPRSTKEIGKDAFLMCTGLKKIKIPILLHNVDIIGIDENTKVKKY